jgi:drug/metabolite transporter (DMT)-like permease
MMAIKWPQCNMPIQVQASLAVLSAQLCFSGWHIVGSVAFRGGTNPFVFILYRLLIGTALMHVYIKVYKMDTYINPIDHSRMIAAGILSFLNVLCGSLSLKFIAPARFAIFQPCIPCVVTALCILFKLEQMSPLKILGISLAVAGAFIAELWKMGGGDSAQEANVPVGVFFATAQVLAMGSLLVVVKPLLNKYEPAVVSGMYFIVSCAAIVFMVICRIDTIPLYNFAFNGQALSWVALLYVATFATLYSFSAINWGGKFLPPTVTTVFFTFQPVGTIILSATLLGVGVTIPEVVGGMLIVAGLVVTSLAQYRAGQQVASKHVSYEEDLQSEEDGTENGTDGGNGESVGQRNVLHDVMEIEFKPRSRSAGSTGSASYNPMLLNLQGHSTSCSASARGYGSGRSATTAASGASAAVEDHEEGYSGQCKENPKYGGDSRSVGLAEVC